MADTALLWAAGARKEVMDLIQTVWTSGDVEARNRLADAIVNGPPEEQLLHMDVAKRQEARDRMVFDRIDTVAEVGDPPLSMSLQAERNRLHTEHPAWRAREGERSHFNTWTDMWVGPTTRYSMEDLSRLEDSALIKVVIEDKEMREGLLDAWRQLGNAEPARMVSLLEQLMRRQGETPLDLWEYGLWGVREAVKQPNLCDRVIHVLDGLGPSIFDDAQVSGAIADILEVAAQSQPALTNSDVFWRVFDRVLHAAELDPANSETPDRDWVSLAINRSMGRVATAFFSALFARELKVGVGLPEMLRPRLGALISPGALAHRPARVIAASRLSYLYAVDPKWADEKLIGNFDWTADEEEALAVWQGYAWQPRIDRKLWSALKPHFLLMFTPERLTRLGDTGRSLAQMLALVGIEFGLEELAPADARQAIRAMPAEMRTDVVSWLASYLAQSKKQDPTETQKSKRPSKAHGVDELWTTKVKPWVSRVWPREPSLQSTSIAEQFALVAIATDKQFPDAVKAVMPFLVPTNAYYVQRRLAESTHPERHPLATLNLIDGVTDPIAPRFGGQLQQILNRLRKAEPSIIRRATFRTWIGRTQVQAGG